jgi:hypothetical protein
MACLDADAAHAALVAAASRARIGENVLEVLDRMEKQTNADVHFDGIIERAQRSVLASWHVQLRAALAADEIVLPAQGGEREQTAEKGADE